MIALRDKAAGIDLSVIIILLVIINFSIYLSVSSSLTVSTWPPTSAEHKATEMKRVQRSRQHPRDRRDVAEHLRIIVPQGAVQIELRFT